MLLLALIGLAFAQPPDGVDPEDIDHWSIAAEAVLDGPAGCWEVVGEATWNWDFGRFGANRGSAAFVSRFEGGEWGRFHLEPLGEIARGRGRFAKEGTVAYDRSEAKFVPLIGKLQGGSVTVSSAEDPDDEGVELEEDSTVNVLREVLDRIGGESESTWAQWDEVERAMVLERMVPIGKSNKEARISSRFPEGRDVPAQVDVVLPERVAYGILPRITIQDASVKLRGRDHRGSFFPTAETVHYEASVLGFRFSGDQTIVYRKMKRCPVDAAPTPASPTPAASPAPAAEG